MLVNELNQNDILSPSEEFHFSRTLLSHAKPRALHRQDFYELFWLESGKARLNSDTDQTRLDTGDLVFIPPETAHAVQGNKAGSHVINLAITPSRVRDLCHRFPQFSNFFGAEGSLPIRTNLGDTHLKKLAESFTTLEQASRKALHLEAFLLPLMATLLSRENSLPSSIPHWLANALARVQDPEVFRQGAIGLVNASGKAHAHVARTMQLHLKQTPSDHINALRMDHVARKLKATSVSLPDIAAEIGISNMSHFHRLFRARFDMTPRQYRTKHQKGVVQPN